MKREPIENINDYSVSSLRDPNRVLNYLALVREKITNNARSNVGLVEFHPCNRCSISCFYCTYRQVNKDVFPFDRLDRLTVLAPRAIVITGGGEVTEYRSGTYTFNDLVLKIREMFPETVIGVTTNGQQVPGGDWQRHVSWLRVSIDAADEKTFLLMKGAPLENTLSSLCTYINGPIPQVGAGFVFSRFNMPELNDFLRKVLARVLRHCGPSGIDKLNFQFRPTCLIESCDCPSSNYLDRSLLMVPDKQRWWQDYLHEQKELIFCSGGDEHWYSNFLRQRTNLDGDTLFNYTNAKPIFRHCYLSLVRAIVRPTGDVYPCVMRASNFGAPIANILDDDDTAGRLIAGQERFYSLTDDCCGSCHKCCRIDGQKNSIIEEALETSAPAGIGREASDWFF